MNINTDKWCRVNLPGRDTIEQGPARLPATYLNRYQFNDDDVTSDGVRNDYGWIVYTLIDSGPPTPPPDQYNRTLSDFVIGASNVVQEAQYTEWTQQQYDQAAPVSPIDWLEIEPAQRQFVDVPYQSQDRLIVGRIFQTWNTPDDIFGLRATLYTGADASGMSIKIHNDDGTYLYTMPLAEIEPGVWYAETQSGSWGQHLERKPWKYYVFKGVDITPLMRLPFEAEQSTHDIKWNPELLVR